MKVRQLRNVLMQWREFLRDRELSDECRVVALFEKLLDNQGDTTVAAFAAALARVEWLGGSEEAPTADAVLPHLNTLIEVYEQGGANRQAGQLRSLVSAISRCGHQRMDASLAAARPQRSQSARPSSELFQSYVKKLQSTASDKDEFETAVAQIQSDRKVTSSMLMKIVNSFSGHEGSFKNKGEAYEWLRSSRIEQARFRNKLLAGDQK